MDLPAPGLHYTPSLEKSDPRSLYHLLPAPIQTYLDEARATKPELFGLDDRSLLSLLRSRGMNPSANDNRIRIKFWMEYERACSQLENSLSMSHIYAGVCSGTYFAQIYIRSPEKLAWMLTPPASYATKLAEALDFGMDEIRDILAQPMILPNGKFDVKLAELKVKIVAMLDLRAKGGIVQRIEQKTASVSVHKHQISQENAAASVTKALEHASMDELNREIAALERRERRALNAPDVPPDPAESPASPRTPMAAPVVLPPEEPEPPEIV